MEESSLDCWFLELRFDLLNNFWFFKYMKADSGSMNVVVENWIHSPAFHLFVRVEEGERWRRFQFVDQVRAGSFGFLQSGFSFVRLDFLDILCESFDDEVCWISQVELIELIVYDEALHVSVEISHQKSVVSTNFSSQIQNFLLGQKPRTINGICSDHCGQN